MKKRFLALGIAFVFSVMLLLAGCGEGNGAEDTGEDGKVGKTSSTTSPTSSHTTPTTSGDTMNGAEDLVEDILPNGDPSAAATNNNQK